MLVGIVKRVFYNENYLCFAILVIFSWVILIDVPVTKSLYPIKV